MPEYDVALIVTLKAPTYEDALADAENLADGIAEFDEIPCSAVLHYERDNDGQRVLYLDPEFMFEIWDSETDSVIAGGFPTVGEAEFYADTQLGSDSYFVRQENTND